MPAPATTTRARGEDAGRVRVLRIIARLNLGGPAHHVTLLGGRLDPRRFDSLLVTGEVGPGEESAFALAAERGARTVVSEHLAPPIDPRRDLLAIREIGALIRSFRPHIVHTHTAKAGLVGRLAAVAASHPRPVMVHTYHGHVLEGYFGPAQTALYRGLERRLAGVTDRLVGVSQATVDDLVRLRIASPDKFVTVPLGLDLDPLLASGRADGEAFRAEAGAGADDVLLTFVGRLVPIKRVDRLLRAFAGASSGDTRLRLAIVGDGELREELEQLAAELGISDAVRFLGYRSDMVAVGAGTDLAVLTSANEGTPVALIEAAASGVPAVATAVGGVADVVRPTGGVLVDQDDEEALERELRRFAADPELRARTGEAARRHVRSTFGVDRLVHDIDELYFRLLAQRR